MTSWRLSSSWQRLQSKKRRRRKGKSARRSTNTTRTRRAPPASLGPQHRAGFEMVPEASTGSQQGHKLCQVKARDNGPILFTSQVPDQQTLTNYLGRRDRCHQGSIMTCVGSKYAARFLEQRQACLVYSSGAQTYQCKAKATVHKATSVLDHSCAAPWLSQHQSPLPSPPGSLPTSQGLFPPRSPTKKPVTRFCSRTRDKWTIQRRMK